MSHLWSEAGSLVRVLGWVSEEQISPREGGDGKQEERGARTAGSAQRRETQRVAGLIFFASRRPAFATFSRST